jgi:Zn-dependent protease with chaperone function
MRNQRVLCGFLAALTLAGAAPQYRKIKPGWNMFSKEQDLQLGREAAAQVEKELTVARDAELTAYVQKVARRLVTQGAAGEDWPFTFKVVHDDAINAFALPGGPMFVHTGLIKASENEGQMAGVLAHEMAHVVLRHGTNNASKAQLANLGLMVAGAASGGGLMGLVTQVGGSILGNSVLMKFSRNAERDADLLGAQIMHRAGYNPVEMARFFEKLEKEVGNRGKLAQLFTGSHPNPGDRVKKVEQEITTFPRVQYRGDEGNLAEARRRAEALGKAPAPKPPSQAPAAAGGQVTPSMTPSGRFQNHRGAGYSLSYPDNWQVFGDAGSGSVTIAPREGLVQQGNSAALGYGMIVALAKPQGQRVDLRADTQALLQEMLRGNPSMKLEGNPTSGQAGGRAALYVQGTSDSPFSGTRETDLVVTADRGDALFYIVFVIPQSDLQKARTAVDEIVRSIRFEQ